MINDFKEKKWNKKRIVIYGAGVEGRIIANSMENIKISNYIFADRRFAGQYIKGKECIDISKATDEDNIILGSGRYMLEMYSNLIKNNISSKNIFLGTSLYSFGFKFNDRHSFKEVLLKYDYIVNAKKLQAYLCGGWFMPRVELIVTEKCTLRCKACSERIPDYKSPQNTNTVLTLNSLQNILELNGWVGTCEIVGGEPFINQEQMISIFYSFGKNQQIGTFQFITNGTIVPSRKCLEAMQYCDNIFGIFSNYKELSKNQDSAIKILDIYNIDSCIEEESDFDSTVGNIWIDFGKLVHYNKTSDEFQKMYEECLDRIGCTTLLKGKLYKCPRIAHGVNMGIIPDDLKDLCIDFLDDELIKKGVPWIKQRFEEWYEDNSYSKACEWCNRNSGKLVERAEQIKSGL